MKEMKDTKEKLLDFLERQLKYYINYEPNPFIESQMVSYISNGINKLNGLGVNNEDIVILYDKDGNLEVRKENE